MLKQLKVLDLAHRLAAQQGLSLKTRHQSLGDISIEFTGLRPGEKLYEELTEASNFSGTSHPEILRVEEQEAPPVLDRCLQQLKQADQLLDPWLALIALEEALPDFKAAARTREPECAESSTDKGLF